MGGERLLRDRVEAEAGGQHQPLLRSTNGDVDTPFLVAIVHRGQGADRVDHEERGVARPVDRPPHRRDVASDPGRGLVVDDTDRRDPPCPVLGEHGLDPGRVDRRAPIALEEDDLEPEPAGHLLPERGEVTGLDHEHAIARRERVDERGFPGPRARGGVDDHRPARAEDPLQPVQDRTGELLERGPAMVDRRAVHGAQDAVGDVGRPRDLQEMAAGAVRLRHRGPSSCGVAEPVRRTSPVRQAFRARGPVAGPAGRVPTCAAR
jgi:hypothetical protein